MLVLLTLPYFERMCDVKDVCHKEVRDLWCGRRVCHKEAISRLGGVCGGYVEEWVASATTQVLPA